MNPGRIRLQRAPGWRMPEGAVKVDRSTKWGNPFLLSEVGFRFPSLTGAQCAGFVVNEFRDLVRAGSITTKVRVPGGEEVVTFTYPSIEEIVAELRGRVLACWCKAEYACHADVLLEVANR